MVRVQLNLIIKKTLHRSDGPAIVWYNGNKYWYQNGKLHREDGPAIEYTDGAKYWYYKGKWLEQITSQEKYQKYLKLRVFW